MPKHMLMVTGGLMVLITFLAAPTLRGQPADGTRPLETIVFEDEKKIQHEVTGGVLVEADDGLLVVEQDGRLWTVENDRLQKRTGTMNPFVPLPPAVLGQKEQATLGAGFDVVVTKHYVVVCNAGKPYAQWCAALFERLYAAFHNYWKQRGLTLTEPEFPLVAIVFANEREFGAFATKDAGPDVASAKGYFNIATNRMVLYDLTAIDGRGAGGGSAADISRRLAASPYNVATVIHEATHQIAFNSGMHLRYADNPLWLTEGMAMYFETPDLQSQTGWRTIGALNRLRHRQFLDLLKKRPRDSLTTLIESDARLTDPATSGEAYAEAWALSYFLIKTRKTDYAAYLQKLGAKPRLQWDDKPTRLAEFKTTFGEDLQKIDTEFVRYMQRAK